MFVLFTDTNSDITPKVAKECGYQLISMPYVINEKEMRPYVDFEEFDYKEFYNVLRSGVVPKTSAISPGDYMKYFEPFLKEGKDILYVHFSSAMSGTFNAMRIAIEELEELYPERKIYTIDTKSISIGSLNILYEVSDMVKSGKSIEEILEWSKTEIYKFATYFFVDNLDFLKYSGRLSNFSAAVASVLGIKPIIYIDNEGRLTSIAKGKGRHGALKKLLTYIENLEENIKDHKILIVHSDEQKIAEDLGAAIKEKYGEDLDIEYLIVNPTIGSHCGPSCIGVSFHSKSR